MLRRTGVICLLAVVLAAMCVLATSVGAAGFSVAETARAILAGPKSPHAANLAEAVVWQLRLPRICLAVLGGAALGLAGSAMQGILRNPLASPFTLGIASAAGFGAALAITLGVGVVGVGQYLIVGNAFVFALAAAGLVFGLSRLRGMTTETMILSGVAVMYLFAAMSSILQYIGDSEEVRAVVFWVLGSLEAASWTKVGVIALVFVITGPLLYMSSWDLNALASGDETAASVGVNLSWTRARTMFLSALLTAAIICFTGTIGFVGLVAPHMSRMIVGVDHRYQMPVTALLGALILLVGDMASRTLLPPHVLPVGIMTSFLGVPFFVYLMVRRRRELW